MPRKSSQTFRSDAMEELTRQLRYVPVKTRHDQVRRAEKLHDEIEPDANYPFGYLKYRISHYREDEPADLLLVGEAVLPDLRLLIDRITASAPLPLTENEPVETIAELATRLNVSEKTIARWRRKGLRWRWVQRPDEEQPCIAMTRDAIELFQLKAGGRVERAKAFSRIDEKTRESLIEQARAILADAGDGDGADQGGGGESLSPHQLAVRLAPKFKRSVESIRQLLDDHDRTHSDQPLFPQRSHPLTQAEKHQIAAAFQSGESARDLAKRFGKTASSIRRAVYELRAAALHKLTIEWVPSPTFTRNDADEVLLRPEPMVALINAFKANKAGGASKGNVDDLPEPIQPVFAQPTLDAEHQRSLAVRMNYLKFRASKHRDALDRHVPRVRDMNLIQDDLEQAGFIRDSLVACNLPTVLSVARRHLISLPDGTQNTAALLAILEIGVEVLVEEVERYDPRRNRTFQRHVTWATMSELSHREADLLNIAREADETGRTRAKSRGNVRMNRSAGTVLNRMRKTATSHGVSLPTVRSS